MTKIEQIKAGDLSNLRRVDLSGANLSGADLSGANLRDMVNGGDFTIEQIKRGNRVWSKYE